MKRRSQGRHKKRRNEMRCYYCDGEANDIERLGNTNIPVCHRGQCQEEYYDAEEDRKERNRNYDNWATRSE